MTTSSTNPYSAPQSNLELDKTRGDVPSISEALSRGYDFAIGDVLSEAWGKVSGSKGTIIGAALLTFLLMFVMLFLIAFISAVMTKVAPGLGRAIQLALQIIFSALIYPLVAGLFLIGIRRAANYPIRFTLIFDFFNKAVPLLLSYLLINLVILVPTGVLLGVAAALVFVAGLPSAVFWLAIAIVVIYSIYLGIAYLFTLPLIVERDLSAWQALEASRKAVSQHWFKVFGLMLLCYILMVLSGFTLFIASIWIVPLSLIALGIVYRTIFGVLPPAN